MICQIPAAMPISKRIVIQSICFSPVHVQVSSSTRTIFSLLKLSSIVWHSWGESTGLSNFPYRAARENGQKSDKSQAKVSHPRVRRRVHGSRTKLCEFSKQPSTRTKHCRSRSNRAGLKVLLEDLRRSLVYDLSNNRTASRLDSALNFGRSNTSHRAFAALVGPFDPRLAQSVPMGGFFVLNLDASTFSAQPTCQLKFATYIFLAATWVHYCGF